MTLGAFTCQKLQITLSSHARPMKPAAGFYADEVQGLRLMPSTSVEFFFLVVRYPGH